MLGRSFSPLDRTCAKETTALFFGSWSQTLASSLKVELSSPVCDSTGLQLIRIFELEAAGRIHNHADNAQRRWRRIAASEPLGTHVCARGGIASFHTCGQLLTISQQYVLYDFNPPETILFQPNDPNIVVRDGLIEIGSHCREAHEKIGFDSDVGWLAYLSKEGQLLVKRFAVHSDRVYGEMAGLTCCVWSYRDRLVGLVPIGPLVYLAPDVGASFVEHGSLLPFPFPQGEGETVDAEAVKSAVDGLAPPRL